MYPEKTVDKEGSEEEACLHNWHNPQKSSLHSRGCVFVPTVTGETNYREKKSVTTSIQSACVYTVRVLPRNNTGKRGMCERDMR